MKVFTSKKEEKITGMELGGYELRYLQAICDVSLTIHPGGSLDYIMYSL